MTCVPPPSLGLFVIQRYHSRNTITHHINSGIEAKNFEWRNGFLIRIQGPKLVSEGPMASVRGTSGIMVRGWGMEG